MPEAFSSLPFSFWVALTALVYGGVWASGRLRAGVGLPMLAVLGTAAAWYVGDWFYNYDQGRLQTFAPDILAAAWWQVALFLTVLAIAVPIVHDLFNASHLQRTSSVYRMLRTGVNDSHLQQQLNLLFLGCALLWAALALIAAIRLGSDISFYVFPFLDHKADPWGRDRLGGEFDAFLSLAAYLQLFVSASFGVVAALATSNRVRSAAFIACAIAWPYFVFDRTRNVMLSTMLPGILTWTCLRLRGGWIKKGVVLAGFFLLISAWFGFVLANRSRTTIVDALQQDNFGISNSVPVHHEGLNMYEELCWINALIDSGIYQPNWGTRYFAEVVSPIPRFIWPEKPAIGLDYAVARGQTYADVGLGATISTGMIGQGVVNFGRALGPAFAAVLMSLWVAILARLDLLGSNMILYVCGVCLTFNLGRDITLITLYTFVFGALVVWLVNKFNQMYGRKGGSTTSGTPRFVR